MFSRINNLFTLFFFYLLRIYYNGGPSVYSEMKFNEDKSDERRHLFRGQAPDRIGGVESAETAFEYLQCGASAVQICSAVQNQDFTLIDDYCTGLKALLYLDGRLPGWLGQSPPTLKHQKGKGTVPLYDENGKKLPPFGPYQKKREDQLSRLYKLATTDGVVQVQNTNNESIIAKNNTDMPTVKNIIGRALPRIGAYKRLDNTKQVVALIDDDMCINCGKCYMTCNDSGYQAIRFDPERHIPKVAEEDCTGCTLCLSVCPIIDCITMVPKSIPHVIKRGRPGDVLKGVHALAVNQ